QCRPCVGSVAWLSTLSAKRDLERSFEVQVPNAGEPDTGRTFVLLVEPESRGRQASLEHLGRAGYEVIIAATLADARTKLDRTPDIHAAVLEYQLPDGTAVELVRALLERRPLCRAVVTPPSARPEEGAAAARAGAHVYLRQPHGIPELLDAVSRTIHATREWRHALKPSSAPVVGRAAGHEDAPLPVSFDVQRAMARLRYVANLSPAETMTAWRLLWGDSNKRMAELMGCTERTVKFHVAEVLARTGSRSRAGLLRVLLEDAGLRDPWDARGGPDSRTAPGDE